MQEMFFEHDYARSKRNHRVVYIEYSDGLPFSVITDVNGIQHHFDFENDCKEWELFMFYHSGFGGKITELQAPQFIENSNCSVWIHPEAKFAEDGKPINCIMLDEPLPFNQNTNPFENGREIYGRDYCKFCEKCYDEDACPEHHVVNDAGELEYFDGSKVDN